MKEGKQRVGEERRANLTTEASRLTDTRQQPGQKGTWGQWPLLTERPQFNVIAARRETNIREG